MPYQVEQTEIFKAWHLGLRDLRARAAIYRRIDRARAGLLGDIKPVGGGVSEMRVDVGPGWFPEHKLGETRTRPPQGGRGGEKHSP